MVNYDPKTSLGLYSQVSKNTNAVNHCLHNIREFHYNIPIFLSCDGNVNSYDIEYYTCMGHGAEVMINNLATGYPVQPFGYRKEKCLEWLRRMHCGVLKLQTSHFMLLEEDSCFFEPIEFDEEWECAGHNITHGNEIPDELLEIIKDFSGVYPNTNRYNTGGCSIFKSSTFLKNFVDIHEWLDDNLDYIQNMIYPTIGWLDCLHTIYYMLAGKEITVNPRLYNLDPHDAQEAWYSKHADREFLQKKYGENYGIVHNFKKFY